MKEMNWDTSKEFHIKKMELFWIIISFQYLDNVSYPYEV